MKGIESLETTLLHTEEQNAIAKLLDQHPNSIIEYLEDLDEESVKMTLQSFEIEKLIEFFPFVDGPLRTSYVEYLSDQTVASLLSNLPKDISTDIIEEMDNQRAQKILHNHPQEDVIRKLLTYEPDSAGGIMDSDFFAVNIRCTIGETRRLFRKFEQRSSILFVYVVDDNEKLMGVVSIRSLILNKARIPIAEVMTRNVISVHTDVDQEDAASIARDYHLLVLPVINKDGVLMGRITIDDLMGIMEDEASEDMLKMAGTENELKQEDTLLNVSKARLPWLITGLIGGIFAALCMSFFEESFQTIIALAFFVPVITALAGNVGMQSSAIVVRGLATGDITPVRTAKKIFFECKVGILNGLVLALLIFTIETLWLKDIKLGIVLGISTFSVIVFASVIGTSVPLLLKKADIDPALATGPFVTTLNDILGLVIYMSFATFGIQFL